MSLSSELREAGGWSREEKVAWGSEILRSVERLVSKKGSVEQQGSSMVLRGPWRTWAVIDLDYNKRKARVRSSDGRKSGWLAADPKKLAARMLDMISP
jgi:hypothetical protein